MVLLNWANSHGAMLDVYLTWTNSELKCRNTYANSYADHAFWLLYNFTYTAVCKCTKFTTLHCCNIVYLQHGDSNYCRQNDIAVSPCIVCVHYFRFLYFHVSSSLLSVIMFPLHVSCMHVVPPYFTRNKLDWYECVFGYHGWICDTFRDTLVLFGLTSLFCGGSFVRCQRCLLSPVCFCLWYCICLGCHLMTNKCIAYKQ